MYRYFLFQYVDFLTVIASLLENLVEVRYKKSAGMPLSTALMATSMNWNRSVAQKFTPHEPMLRVFYQIVIREIARDFAFYERFQ
jgi:hypothetical protein